MLDGSNYIKLEGDQLLDSGDEPPALEKEDGWSQHCDFCERQIVHRCGGFCRTWDQMYGCEHSEEADEIIMRD